MIVNNLLFGVAKVLDTILFLYMWVVIISALMSWVNPDPYNPIVRTLRSLTEPVFYKIRQWIPFVVIGGIDLSPIAVLLLIQFAQIVIVNSLYGLAGRVMMG